MGVAKNFRILLTGGGTGGHLFPGIAIVEALKSKLEGNAEVLFIGTRRGLEARIVPRYGYRFRPIWIRGFQRGWNLRSLFINLLFPVRLLVSLIHTRLILKHFNPDVVIGTGGYTSGPPLQAAAAMQIPIFLQEQNVAPGITTKLMAGKASAVYVSYEKSLTDFPNGRYFGTPLRNTLNRIDHSEACRFFNLDPNTRTIFVFGGSQGAHAINEFLYSIIDDLLQSLDCQFIWQTGQSDFEKINVRFNANKRVFAAPFIYEMEKAYSAADLVISRSGALTLAELCHFGLPSLLIPLPSAAGNHQEKNARAMEEEGASMVMIQRELDGKNFKRALCKMVDGDSRLKEMAENAARLSREDAAGLIAADILRFLKKDF